MKTKGKPQMKELIQAIGELAAARRQLAHQAQQQYACEIDEVLQKKDRNPQRIEHLLDGMLDFCFDNEVLRLYKKLCRYYFKIDPEATAWYINAYREMWDEGEERGKLTTKKGPVKGGKTWRREDIHDRKVSGK